MSRWLLSGHNPQETLGISYPLSASYIADFTSRQQMEYVLSSLAGGSRYLDLSMPLIARVGGLLYSNVNYCLRNIALVFPFDPASIGVPPGLVTSEHKPRLTTLLLLPFRFGRLYRRAAHNLRTVLPRFRETLDQIYWQLRDAAPDHLTAQDLALIDRLFEPPMLECLTAYANALLVIGLPNITVLQWVNDKAPALRNLLVGHGTNTAQLGERMWELRQVAVQCGPPVVQALRGREVDLDTYRAIPAAAPLLETLGHFLRTYGHRAFHYASEFEATRLVDQPDLVLLTIASLLEVEESPAVRAHGAREASHRALQEMNPIRRFFWRQLLKWGGALIEGREENRNTMELQNATYGLAARLLSQHYFQSSDYLWLYQFDEFLAFAQSHGQVRVDAEVIAQRRTELEQDRRQAAPPELIWYDPATKEWWPAREERTGSTAAYLQGIGVSAGSGPVEGVALVTDSAQEAAERLLGMTGPVVLVTHVTDPVWSSLFRRLTAVVTEMGGAISHAAIVARENGVPTVVGASDATRCIQDGQWVRVDGAAGSVEVIG
jgi:pyruvate,water dikinase